VVIACSYHCCGQYDVLVIVELVQNHCLQQQTCGDCLAAGPPCGWCRQEVSRCL